MNPQKLNYQNELKRISKYALDEQDLIQKIDIIQKVKEDAKKYKEYYEGEKTDEILNEMPNVNYLQQIVNDGEISNIYKPYNYQKKTQEKQELDDNNINKRAGNSNIDTPDDITRQLQEARILKLGNHLKTISINPSFLKKNPIIQDYKTKYDKTNVANSSSSSSIRIAADVLALKRANQIKKEIISNQLQGYLNMGYMAQNIKTVFNTETNQKKAHEYAANQYCIMNSNTKDDIGQKHSSKECHDLRTAILPDPDPYTIEDSNALTTEISNVSQLNDRLNNILNKIQQLYLNKQDVDKYHIFMELMDNPFMPFIYMNIHKKIDRENGFDVLTQITRLYYIVKQLLEDVNLLIGQLNIIVFTSLVFKSIFYKKCKQVRKFLNQIRPNIERLIREMLNNPDIQNAQTSLWLGVSKSLYSDTTDNMLTAQNTQIKEDVPVKNSIVQWNNDSGSTNGYTLLNLKKEHTSFIFVEIQPNPVQSYRVDDFYIIYIMGDVQVGFIEQIENKTIKQTDLSKDFNQTVQQKIFELNELSDDNSDVAAYDTTTPLTVRITESTTVLGTIVSFSRDTYGNIKIRKIVNQKSTEIQLPSRFITNSIYLVPYVKLTGISKIRFRIGKPFKNPEFNLKTFERPSLLLRTSIDLLSFIRNKPFSGNI